MEKITAAKPKNLLNSLTFVSFAPFAVQSYPVPWIILFPWIEINLQIWETPNYLVIFR
ncbi:hypothetical protein [Sphaerospermopsis torques-reginae]|uniref:Uncharacterized protein n=1 Tax=Sphaerospermopsis torques-reginae ITEP-024 TaxID=984208 RepID=A0ABX8X383_9CYAN|nr:hypothetical protein [Sphaerospermopsis torques-reginae]QYX33110.1 hypothetical protein K2F26_07225 [Sphaerospermopsis torques-reginae ITEP-024]